MGWDLYREFPAVRPLFQEADDVLGFSLSRVMRDGSDQELRRTANAQPAILLASVAAYHALGLTPAATAGHSLGEYSALVAAGSLAFRDAILLVRRRGEYMQEAVADGRGIMLALVGVNAAAVAHEISADGGNVDIANYNAPGQIVIAGEREATYRVARRCAARQTIELSVSAPFHCRLMATAELRLRVDLAATPFRDPQITFYNNVDACKITSADEVRAGLARQVSRPVLWTTLVERLIADQHIESFVEVGPGTVLMNLIRRIDRNVLRFTAGNPASIAKVRHILTDQR